MQSRGTGSEVSNVVLALPLWGLTRWSRLLYLDIDLLAVRSLEPIWRLRIGVEGALVAASYAIRAKTYKGVAEASCGLLRPGNLAYNTGLVLLQPSTHLARALDLQMRLRWSKRYKSACASDQTYFNTVFVGHTRCLAYSSNCRDPQFLNQSAAPDPRSDVSVLSRCLEPLGVGGGWPSVDAGAPQTKDPPPLLRMPFTVHFACQSKPWLPANQHLFFVRNF